MGLNEGVKRYMVIFFIEIVKLSFNDYLLA